MKMNLVNTDKAWETLHNRLEQENLIPENKNKQIFRHISHFGNIVAAAVVLLCIFVGSGIYLLSDKRHGDLLSMSNDEGETSLVTTFEDGSTAYLSGNTSIYYPEHFRKHERRIKVDGDALFDINREPERPFYIETEHALVKVLGTAFRINTNNNTSFELSVKHGLVEVSSKLWSKPVLVAAGETVSLQNGNLIKRNLTSDQFTKFTSKIRFKNERLDNILRVINRSTGANIVLDSNDLKDLKLNVSFRNNSVDTMMKVICIGLNLEYTMKDNTIHIYKP